MTMIKPLDSFMQLGKQESMGVYEMESEVALHDTLVKSATRTQGGDPEGIEFPVRIQLASDPSEWMTAFATYTLDAGVHKLEVSSNDKVIASSSNDVRISFSTTSDSLRFSGISSSDLFEQLDARLIPLEGAAWTDVVGAGGADPAFKNSWVSFDTARKLRYRLRDGYLQVSGAVKSGTTASAIITTFTDAAHQPAGNRFQVSYGSTGIAAVLLDTSGNLNLFSGGSTTFTYLDVQFPL